MTPAVRRWVFLAGAAGLAAFYLWGLTGLPGFGHYPGPYGDLINRIAVAQTKATGVVSAINFEYRGFDTLGEEFILFTPPSGWPPYSATCAASGSARPATRRSTGTCPSPAMRSGWCP